MKQIAYVNLMNGKVFDRLCGQLEYEAIKQAEAAKEVQIFIDGRNPRHWEEHENRNK